MLDLIFKNAKIVEGTGHSAFHGDVGVKDGKIATIGHVEEAARETIDGGGRVVCPGFIDVHTHYDAQVFWDKTLSPSCYHGVTTVFGGFCGFSIAPLSREAAPYLLSMLARVEGMPAVSLQQGVPWDWESFADYLGKLEGNLGLNAGFMAGHSAIRRVVMGERAVAHKASAAELEAMTSLLARCLKEGAMGFSSTISPTHNDAAGQPVPSRHASHEELIALAGVCREYEGTSLELLPAVGRFSDEIIQLMSNMSVAAQRPLNWNALSVGDPDIVMNQLSSTDYARKNGGEIIALATAARPEGRLNLHSGFGFDFFDGWDRLFRLPVDQRIEALRDKAFRKELAEGAARSARYPIHFFAAWENYTVEAAVNGENKRFEGRTIGSIAKELGKEPFDAFIDLSISEGLRTSVMPHEHLDASANERELWEARARVWADNRTVIGASDAGAHLDMIDSFSIPTQVLAKGVREFGVISLEEAVHQLTEVPAKLFGLRERGLLREGWHADILVFDPAIVGCGKTYVRWDLPAGEPRLYADALGIDHVFVNGVQIIREGKHTNALPGKVLRSGVDTETARMPIPAGAVR